MSNYIVAAVHPETLISQKANWIDDHYGKHLYGIKFPDGQIFPEGEVREAAMKLDKQVETKRMIEVMQAHINGDDVEFMVKGGEGEWMPFKDGHRWNWITCDYRAKKVPRVIYCNYYKDGFGGRYSTLEEANDNEGAGKIGVVRFVEDMEWVNESDSDEKENSHVQ
tara:strand:- start:3193 stop:3690 length:498 start_codon:yes stop_codon:yes gene_type:complete